MTKLPPYPLPDGVRWRATPSGVLLPQIAQPFDDHPLFNYVQVALGHELITGTRTNWDALAGRLQHYTLETLLIAASRMTTLLAARRKQHDLAIEWLGANAPLTRKAVECMREWRRKYGEEPMLFYNLQVLNLVKAAFLVLPAECVPDGTSKVDLAPFAEALLMMTDMIEDSVTDDSWAKFLLANGLFHSRDFESHALARSHDVFLAEHKDLQGSRYVDLPTLMSKATGLDPLTLWSALFALFSNQKRTGSNGDWPMPVHETDYFRKDLSLTEEELAGVWRNVGADADLVKEEIVASYTPEDLRAYDILPLQKWPMIRIRTRYFCPSADLVYNKVARGLHHLVLSSTEVSKKEKDRYLAFLGDTFEDYVTKLFRRSFGDRYIALDRGGADEGIGIADGIIVYGDTAIVVEVKAPQFSQKTAAGRNPDVLKRNLNDIFVDGMKQIVDTTSRIRRGMIPAVPSATITRIFPFIVTYERMPMNPFMYAAIEAMIREAGVAPPAFVAPFQVCDIDDLEFVEVALDKGASLLDLLERKTLRKETREQAFGNYCIDTNVAGFRHKNEFLGARFREISDAALLFFQKRGRSQIV